MSLFKGILNAVKKPLAFVAKAGGTLIGLPALGTAAGNLINSIGGEKKVAEMAQKAVEAGAVSAQKVEETIVKSGVPATPQAVAEVSKVIQNVAVKNDQFPVDSKEKLKIEASVDSGSASSTAKNAASLANSPFQKFISYVKQYWFVALPVSVLLGYSLYKQFIKK